MTRAVSLIEAGVLAGSIGGSWLAGTSGAWRSRAAACEVVRTVPSAFFAGKPGGGAAAGAVAASPALPAAAPGAGLADSTTLASGSGGARALAGAPNWPLGVRACWASRASTSSARVAGAGAAVGAAAAAPASDRASAGVYAGAAVALPSR